MPTERPGPPPSPPPAAQGEGPTPAPSGEVEDRELVARLRRGDQAALALLYDRYGGIVMALLLRIVGHRGECEDLLQEVFLQVWRRAPEFDPQRGSFSSWLFTIARNRALDVVRSPRHKNLMSEPAVEGPRESPEHSPEESASLMQRAQAVRTALEDLSAAQREAVELAYYGGLSHSEIASKTGEPLGTIKSRINQAAARLRLALQRLGGKT